MAKDAKKTKGKQGKKLWVIIGVAAAVVIAAAVIIIICCRDAAKYSRAVEQIEDGNFKDGYDTLIEIAKDKEDYKDTNELLYTRAIELIETGVLENKQEAYKMLEQIYGYKHTDSIAYYLWVEDVYDPDDDNTFEQADGFMQMIPEDYDGPFAEEIEKYRNDIKKSMEELNRKKYEAAMETDDEFITRSVDLSE